MARDNVAVLVRLVVGVTAVAVGVLAGRLLFVRIPDSFAELLGVLLTVGVALAAIRAGGRIAESLYPTYNAAEVTVEGPIGRDPSDVGPTSGGTPADDLVEQIERADEDTAAEALLLELNTPGGEVLPSEDIRSAAAAFDGPTVAYATDQCASGGMWIASGCDELWAREASQVESVGVSGLRPDLTGFLNDRGVTFEEITAGEYKDASLPVTEFSEADREYLQGLTDGFYDRFVERVTEGTDLDPETVRETGPASTSAARPPTWGWSTRSETARTWRNTSPNYWTRSRASRRSTPSVASEIGSASVRAASRTASGQASLIASRPTRT